MNSSAQPSPSDSEPKSWHKVVVALLALAFFVTPYLFSGQQNKTDALGAELVGDGLILVTGHPAQRAAQRGAAGLAQTVTTGWWGGLADSQALYRPVPSFLMGLAGLAGGSYNEAAPGHRTFPYHAITLGLNVLCALLVLELAWLIFRNAKAALISGALFATLPIHGEVIFDVAGLAELSASAFSLAAWIAWIRAGDQPFQKLGQLAIALVCLFFATLSKESAFALPLVFFLFDMGRTKSEGGIGAGVGHALSKLPALAACAVVLAVSLALRYQVIGELAPSFLATNHLDNPLLAEGFLTRAMNAIRLMGAGVLSMFGVNTLSSNWNYSPDYSANQISIFGPFGLWNLIGLVGVGGALALAALLYKKCRTRSALVFALFGSMLLTSNLLFEVGTIYADRLMFFPSVIAMMLLAGPLSRLGQTGVIAGLLLSVAGGYWTWSNGANHWDSQTNLWTYAANKAAPDSARAHYNNGVDASKDQVYGLALKEFQKALEIFPNHVEAHYYSGMIHMQPQEYDPNLACDNFMAACEAQLANYNYSDFPSEPSLVEGSIGPRALLYRLSLLRLTEEDSKDPEAHLAWLDSLIAKGYNSAYVHHRRAVTLRALDRMPEAEEAFEKSISIEVTVDCVQAYGKILLDAGRRKEALTLYRTTDEFEIPGQNVAFLLSRAEAEWVEGPEAVLALANQLWDMRNSLAEEGTYNFTPEQDFETLYLRAQAKLQIYGTEPTQEQLLELRKILRNAIGIYGALTPKTIQASAILATVHLQLGEDDDARVILAALLLQEEAPSMRNQLAGIYVRQGRFADALDQYTHLDRLLSQAANDFSDNPDAMRVFIEARGNILRLLATLDRSDEIETTIGRWHENAPNEFDPVALYIQGFWAISLGDMDAAFAAADTLKQQFPEDANGDQLAKTIVFLKDLETRADSGNDPAVLEELARARRGLGDGKGALEMAQRAVELSGAAPTEERARRFALLAACHEMLEDLNGAINAVRSALELTLSDEDKAVFEGEFTRLEARLAQ